MVHYAPLLEITTIVFGIYIDQFLRVCLYKIIEIYGMVTMVQTYNFDLMW